MGILKKTAVGIVTGFLISAPYAPAFAASHDAHDSRPPTSDLTIPCGPLSWDAANKLPWSIRASEVECMSPTQDDLQASIQARSLLTKAAAQAQSDKMVSGSTAETEYEDGINAYAAGQYIEAIGHLQAAIPPAKP
jgi:hypothetical protein